MGLLSLLHNDASHLVVLVNHALDHLINLRTLFLVLFARFFAKGCIHLNLRLDVLLVLFELAKHLFVLVSLHLLIDFIVTEHHHVDVRFVFLLTRSFRY